ncbi:MAG: aromatic ring-hydroxylating dioxygenase subunit alpha [Paracoccaceae bacterium]|uniref:aromatic ring-hydroxylating oxygenase subunit alpha n=1 Tax=Candidatus Salinivivens marinus TaxID=3381703 RepID=UPI0026AD8898
MEEGFKELISKYQGSQSLPRQFYTSETVYKMDIQHYWNHSWIWVGHINQIPNVGDFFVFDYGYESVIIARDKNDSVNAFLNVCRHRGSRVCIEKSGNTRLFVCPYHAWTYELNGSLRAAREMEENFNTAEYSLKKVNLRIFHGLIFICVADNPPNIDEGLLQLEPLVEPFEFENLKIVHSANYPVAANWKLALENYMECYHCAPAHLEYSRSHSLKDPSSANIELKNCMLKKSMDVGLSGEELHINLLESNNVEMDFYFSRYPLFQGYKTGSKSGEKLAPLLGRLKDFDGGTSDIQIGILNNFLSYSDHVIGYRFIPRSLQITDIEVIWMVREDAEEGKDYNLEDLTWLWHCTSQDDERIIALNQKGVNSNHYVPGPLSNMEWGIKAFHAGYLKQLEEKTNINS